MTREEVKARIAAQMPLEEKRACADFVIDNSGPLEAAQKTVTDAWRALVAEV